MKRKPSAIAWFERLYVFGIVLSVVDVVATWNQTFGSRGDDELAQIGYAAITILYGTLFAFWFFILRRRSNIARWLFPVVMTIPALLTFYDLHIGTLDGWRILQLAYPVIWLGLPIFLFLPDARRWFDGTPDNLAETFS